MSTSESASFVLTNCTGIDMNFIFGSATTSHDATEKQTQCIKDGESSILPGLIDATSTITVHTAHQKTLTNLPLIPASNRTIFLYDWPLNSVDSIEIEPVVESVMQNQRLCFGVIDVFSLDRGKDLLSSTIWSPEFNSANDEPANQLWQKPYLDGDSPEFSDWTCKHSETKESINLPGADWVWANEWEVEIYDGLGITTDADGWEYSEDFDTFNSERRFYKRGDVCKISMIPQHTSLCFFS